MTATTQLENVTKSLDQKAAVDGLLLAVPGCGLHGFSDRKGAGKVLWP